MLIINLYEHIIEYQIIFLGMCKRFLQDKFSLKRQDAMMSQGVALAIAIEERVQKIPLFPSTETQLPGRGQCLMISNGSKRDILNILREKIMVEGTNFPNSSLSLRPQIARRSARAV